MKYVHYLIICGLTSLTSLTCYCSAAHKTKKNKRNTSAQKTATIQKVKKKKSPAATQSRTQTSVWQPETEKKIYTLFEQFLDTKHNKDISWQGFAQEVAALLDTQTGAKDAAKAFKELATETSAWTIAKSTYPYRKKLPASVQKLLNTYSLRDLYNTINKRITPKQQVQTGNIII